ncbi:MAG TPA: LamG-like jellyroll fold domain-containing protein, partial [Bacillota bacterium]|nr:LamG-like jellyroll fold domain-containing protein [Bacillota bacterium]
MTNKETVKFKRVKVKKKPFPIAKFSLFVLLGILFVYFMVSIFNEVNPSNVGSIISEEQEGNKTATIRAVIEVDNAEHLDSDRNFISDITDEIKELDGMWSEEIPDGHYVKVIFEQLLNSKSDITIYLRVVSGEPRIEVYEKDSNGLIAEFTNIISNEYNKVFLTNLEGSQDTFDLKIIGGSIEIEHIIDPNQEILYVTSCTGTKLNWDNEVNSPYLDNSDASYIYEQKTGGATVGDFGFADSAIGIGKINNVTLWMECCQEDIGSTEEYMNVYINDGGGFVDDGDFYPSTSCSGNNPSSAFGWDSITLTTLTTWIEVDAAQMYLEYVIMPAGDDVECRKAYLYVDYNDLDTIYPQFSNPTEYPLDSPTYSYGQSYQFNITITSTNGTAWIRFNNVNSSAQNVSNEFYVNLEGLSAGTNYYNWSANGNGTENNANMSNTYSYTINKATTLSGSISGGSPITYGTGAGVQGTESNNGDGDVEYKLYREGVETTNPDTTVLGVGTYNYIYNSTEGTNYTANSSLDTFELVVNQISGQITLKLNDTEGNINLNYPGQVNASANSSGPTITLLRNGTDVTGQNNQFQNLAVGYWNFTAIAEENQNYTQATITRFATISKGTSVVYTYLDNTRDNAVITNGSEIWLNTTTTTGDSGATLKLYINNTLINQGISPLSNFTLFDALGFFNITGFYLESENYTGSFETWFVFVDGIFPTITFENPTPGNGSTVDSSTQTIVANISDNSGGNTSSWIDFDRSLIGYWAMDYYNSTGIFDNSSYDNFGVFGGGLSSSDIITGNRGNALEFDGVNDYIGVTSNDNLNSIINITASLWINQNNIETNQTLIGKSSYNTNGWRIYLDATNHLNFEIVNVFDNLLISRNILPETGWQHVVFVYDGINQRIYLNGDEFWAYTGNDKFLDVSYYGDIFSDESGNRAYPWGFELLQGDTKHYLENDSAIMIGDSDDDATLLAIPDIPDKPTIDGNLNYTQCFEVKYNITSGNGIRIIHQFFNSTSEAYPDTVVYGDFIDGVNSSWQTICLTSTSDVDSVKGDPIIELWGTGRIDVNSGSFFLTNESQRSISNSGTQPLLIGQTTDSSWSFNGSIDEVIIFNRSLSENEIEALYNSKVNKFNATFENLVNRQYNYTVYAVDEAGNLNNSGERNFIVLDTGAPTVTLPVYTNATQYKNDQSMTYNISVLDSGTGTSDCSINVDTASAGNVTVAVSNGWCNGTYSLAGTNDGNQTINAYANDTLGDTALNDSYVVWVDSSAPSVSTTSVNDTNIVPSQLVCINGTVTDSGVGLDEVWAYITYPNSTLINVTMTDTGSGCGGGTDDWYGVDFNVGSTEGTLTVNTTYANDTLGNLGNESAWPNLQVTVTLQDVTNPIASFGTNPIDYYNDSDGTIVFDMKCSDNVAVDYLILYANWTGTWHANYTNNSMASYNDTWLNITVNGIPEGKGRVWGVWCNDTSSLTNNTVNRTFTVDSGAPTVTLPVYTNATQYRDDQSLIFNVSVSDSGTGASYCSVNVAGSTNQTVAVSSGWCNGTYALTAIGDGNQTINAYANDTAGNTALNNSYVVWVDSSAPTVTLPIYTNATQYREDQSLIFNISVSDSGVGASYCAINVAGSTNQTVAVSSGWCNGTYSLSGIGDGNQTINAYANDTLDNTAINNSYVVWLDSTEPSVSTTSINDTSIFPSQKVCINASVTESGVGLDDVWAYITYPNSTLINITMSDTGSGCGGGADDWYGVDFNVGSAEGTLTVNTTYANDSLGNLGEESPWPNVQVTVSDSAPESSNPSVNDSTPNPLDTVRHNIYWIDDNSLSFARLEVNSTGVGCDTSDNISSTTLSGGSSWANLSWQVPNACEGKTIGWKQYANDSLNQWEVSNLQTYTVNNINPTASFETPVDTYNSTTNSITFELSCFDNLDTDYLILYGNWTGIWHANQTNSTPINDTTWSIQVDGIPEGVEFAWGVWCNDTSVSGNSDWTDTNRTFTVDSNAPTVTLPAYTNATQYRDDQSLIFNISVSDSGVGASYCAVNVAGNTNKTVAVSS